MVKVMRLGPTDLTWREKYPFSYVTNGRTAIQEKGDEQKTKEE